ncbi:MAG: hypothetical protein M0Z33_09700 [Actinomycetota bacterium]|nr:hypothetical protein [Actinomycetota bacterium]
MGDGAPLEQPPPVGRGSPFGSSLLLETGVDGIYGFGPDAVRIVDGVERAVRSLGDGRYEVVRFPPVVPRALLERTGYARSFPDLLGVVETFLGGDEGHRRLLRSLDRGEDWTAELETSDVALCPAACQPLYGTIRDVLPPGGRRFDVCGHVFRHEPSGDPARMMSFRQYEYVYVGDAAAAVSHRDEWLERAADLLAGLGVGVDVAPASDPFYGRAGRPLAESQREMELKYEVVGATGKDAPSTALASSNCHLDHFGSEFAIATSTGEVAHSACVGFGLERIALALLHGHGEDVAAWPRAARSRLGL